VYTKFSNGKRGNEEINDEINDEEETCSCVTDSSTPWNLRRWIHEAASFALWIPIETMLGVVVSVIYNFGICFTCKSYIMRISGFLSKSPRLSLKEARGNPARSFFSVWKLHVTS